MQPPSPAFSTIPRRFLLGEATSPDVCFSNTERPRQSRHQRPHRLPLGLDPGSRNPKTGIEQPKSQVGIT